MKILIILAVLAGCIFLISCFSPKVNFAEDPIDGIKFTRVSWREAVAQAKKENKPIFLDIYASWCGPCKRLKASTFASKKVGDFYNENFINIAIDGEKGEGPMIASEFNIKSYPTLIFLNNDGKIIYKTAGFQDENDFLLLGQNVFAETLNRN